MFLDLQTSGRKAASRPFLVTECGSAGHGTASQHYLTFGADRGCVLKPHLVPDKAQSRADGRACRL